MSEKTDPKHQHKKAVDAFGGDPADPNDVLLERIATAVKLGKKDELVERWAKAMKVVHSEPTPTPRPRRVLLLALADAVSGKKNDAAAEWAKGDNYLLSYYKLER